MKTKDELEKDLSQTLHKLSLIGQELGLKGQVKIEKDFKDLKQYAEVIARLSQNWKAYNHNFEVSEGLNVQVLWH